MWFLRGFRPNDWVLFLVLERLPGSLRTGQVLESVLPGTLLASHLQTLYLLEPCSPQKEEYHTHLAVLYLDKVLQQRSGADGKGAEVTETQVKLRHLLQKSDLYRVHFLMGEEDHNSFSADKLPGQEGCRGQRGDFGIAPCFDSMDDSLGLFGTKSAPVEGEAKLLAPPLPQMDSGPSSTVGSL